VLLLAISASAFRVRPGKKGQKSNSSSTGYVVSLGDSYTSGTGIHRSLSDYYNGEACCRDFELTAGGQVASQQGLQHLMPACAGDEIPQIKDQFSALQASNPAEAAKGWEGSTFMFTIGGNDIRSNDGSSWVDILVNCILSFYGDCHLAEANQVANFPEVQSELVNFYSTMAQGASKASIRVLGYPRLLQRTWLGCIPVPGVALAAADWADSMVDELNGVLKSAVAEVQGLNPGVDIQFVAVKRYLNKGACTIAAAGNHVHSIVLDGETLLSPMTFHPTGAGYNRYYDAVAPTLGSSLVESHVAESTSSLWFPERIFRGWDVAGKGKLSMSDVLHMAMDADASVSTTLRELFAKADANGDGFLNFPEFEGFLELAAEADHAL